MSLYSDIQRLSWRFSSGKAFTPNEGDVEALNGIIDWVNRQKEESLSQNRYFAKIVVSYYIELLTYYNWDNYAAEKALQEILERPLEEWYVKFQMHMNTKSWVDSSDVLGIVDEWEAARPENGKRRDWKKHHEIKENNRKILLENSSEFLKSINPWKIEEITGKLNHFISELLNIYGSKP